MSELKVKNIISNNPNAIPIILKDGSTSRTVNLFTNEVFWCPDDLMTKSLIIYQRKNIIELSNEPKPNGLNYYEAYPQSYLDSLVVNHTTLMEEAEKLVNSYQNEVERQYKKWSDEDIQWLQLNYHIHGAAYCANHMQRSVKSVEKKIEALKTKDDKD